MFERKINAIPSEQVKSERLPFNVGQKIEKVFGTTKEFTHWDFEELLPSNNKAKERARIPTMLKGWTMNGCIKKVGVDDSRAGRARTIYVGQRFPLNFSRKPDGGNTPATTIDSIFFNLGRRKNAQIDIQRLGRIDGRPREAAAGDEETTPVNTDVSCA